MTHPSRTSDEVQVPDTDGVDRSPDLRERATDIDAHLTGVAEGAPALGRRATDRRPRPALMLLAWLGATVLLVICFKAAGWQRIVSIGERIRPQWLFLALCANLAIQPFAAIQWRLLIPPDQRIKLRKMLSVTALSSLAMSTAPILLGHASAIVILSRQAGIGRGTALSVFALEQLTEAIAKVVVVLVAILIAPVPLWMQHGAIILGAIAVALLIFLIFASQHHEFLARWAAGAKPHSMRALLATWAFKLEALRSPTRFLAALLACFGMKAVEGLAILATQHALSVSVPASSAVLILAATGIGTMLPLAPGNLGTYEASVFLAYRSIGVSSADAIALGIVQHLAYLAATTGAGYAVLSAKQIKAWRRPRDRRAQRNAM